MRILIASDNELEARQIAALLTKYAPESPAPWIQSLNLAADRLSRLLPDVVILCLPDTPDPGIKTLRDVCSTVPGIHVFVVGPAVEPQVILSCLQAGAEVYLDRQILEKELEESLTRLRLKLSGAATRRRSGKVLACLGPSGGSGTSVVAANLAVVLAGRHSTCGLVDLRLAAGDLAAMLGLNPQHTLADVCARLDRMDQAMFEQCFVRHSSGAYLLAPPRDFAEISLVSTAAIRRVIDMARLRFPCVVVDLDNAYQQEQVEAIWQADIVFLILRLDYTSIRNARRVMENLVRLGVGLERVRLVANRYGEPREIAAREAETALGMRISHYIPTDAARVNLSINQGLPVYIQKASAKISRGIQSLADNVKE